MAITLDPATRVFSVPQSDLTLVSGTLYDADTDQIRKDMFTLLASESYIWLPDAFVHNAEVTVAGTTYARLIEMINNFSIQFTPNTQWTVRLVGSNNNMFDAQNGILIQNQVQVIPTNSAGLITNPEILDIYKVMGLDINDQPILSGNGETTKTLTLGNFSVTYTPTSISRD